MRSIDLADTEGAVTFTVNAGATPTFSVFVTGAGTVPFDPAANRVFNAVQRRGRSHAWLDQRGRANTIGRS